MRGFSAIRTGVPLALSLCVAWYALARPAVEVRIDGDAIRRALESSLPLVRQDGGTTLSVTMLRTDLRPDGRIGVSAAAGAVAPGSDVELSLAGAGTLAYGDGTFSIEGFKVAWAAPRSVRDPLSEAAAPADGAIGEAAARVGIGGAGAMLASRRDALVERARAGTSDLLERAVQGRALRVVTRQEVGQSPSALRLRGVEVEGLSVVASLSAIGWATRLLAYGAALAMAVLGLRGWLADRRALARVAAGRVPLG